jgi:hypothetical protein
MERGKLCRSASQLDAKPVQASTALNKINNLWIAASLRSSHETKALRILLRCKRRSVQGLLHQCRR